MSQPEAKVLSHFHAATSGVTMLLVRLALVLGLFTATTASAANTLYSAFAAPASHSTVNDGLFLAEADSAGELARKQINDAANNSLDEPVTPFILAGVSAVLYGAAVTAVHLPVDATALLSASFWTAGARAPPQTLI